MHACPKDSRSTDANPGRCARLDPDVIHVVLVPGPVSDEEVQAGLRRWQGARRPTDFRLGSIPILVEVLEPYLL
jgi:hypothetical protein